MKPQSDNEFAAFVGIDWADVKHDLCLQPERGASYWSALPSTKYGLISAYRKRDWRRM